MHFDTQVIVVGAGPVGLTAALQLALSGTDVLLLEKRPGLSPASLASTIHPPTLEILDRLGVLPVVMPQGHVVRTIQHRDPAGVFAEFHMDSLAGQTRFPFRLHLEQSRITPVMLDMLRACSSGRVAFGCDVRHVELADDGVVATVAGPGGEDRIGARYLVAADGAGSVVRSALGIAFDGFAYPDKILRVFTTDDLDHLLPGIAPVSYVYNGKRSVSFLRMPDCWRIILRVPQDTTDAEAMDDAWTLARLQEVLPGCDRMPAPAGRDVYRASRRVADTFRRGRAFVIGDAAHVTSTRGGMNMNCGMHDAAAIAPAIAQALAADDPACAEAVSDARRRVATKALIPRTDRSVSGGPEWFDTLRRMAADPAAAAAYLRTAAMLDMTDGVPAHA